MNATKKHSDNRPVMFAAAQHHEKTEAEKEGGDCEPALDAALAFAQGVKEEAEESVLAPGMSELQARIDDLEAQKSALAEQYMRAQADIQNIRRRAEEEASKARKFAIEVFAESLLPVLDSLEAGLAVDNASIEQMREGVEATLRQLKGALERNKVLEVVPVLGAAFDPNQHQAIGTIPSPSGSGFEVNSVAQILQKGYTIAGRVLRPALVMVVG